MSLELASIHLLSLPSTAWIPDQDSPREHDDCSRSTSKSLQSRSDGSPCQSAVGEIKVMGWIELVWVTWLSTHP